ncbi:questin oxidase family protein [uncultured Psychrobacter sp.]|uniref:questin oxidase family protein n=1 Tax=uncultured Psychrobacter sp. TaxID=259303 RepID=UPI00345946AC
MTFYSAPNYSKHLHDWLKRGREWHIEYDDYLSNHLTHNWIVLDAAGADDEKIQWWQEVYTSNHSLSPAEPQKMLAAPRSILIDYTKITDANWLNNLQSIRIAFGLYRDFFDKKIADMGLSACLKRYYPALSEGMAGAAFHPVIHTGWAVDVDSEDMASEGLAYMATAFQPLATGPNHSKYQLWSFDAPSIIEAFKQIFTNNGIAELAKKAHLLSKTEDYTDLNKGGFQQRLITFNNPEHPMAQFLNDNVVLKLPAIGSDLMSSIETLTVIAATALYSSDNEFFIVHGLTSLHGVLCVLPHLGEAAQRDALAYWFRALVATIIVQGSPSVEKTVSLLEKWLVDKEKAGEYQLTDEQKAWWMKTLQSTTDSYDEHVPKTVYVLKRWAEWQAFSSAAHDIYVKVARNIAMPNASGRLEDNLWFNR